LATRVAIVGAGTGGTLAANLLSIKLRGLVRSGDVKVLLVGQGFRHHFQPGNLEIAFKGDHPDDHSRSEMDLLKPGVTFIPDPASGVDLENRKVRTVGGDEFDYDKVILATGAEAAPQMVPGLAEGSVNFHSGPVSATRVWEAIRGFKKGRVGVLVAGEHYKCPPSPDAALFLLDEYFRHRGIRKDVELTLVTPHPSAYPADKISKMVTTLFDERGIRTIPSFTVEAVDPSAKKARSKNGDVYEYDLLIAVPPHRGARVVRESGIGNDEGWIRADRHSMRIEGHDDAYGVGDANNVPVYKSGVVAYMESKVVASNVANETLGEDARWEYDGRINCPMDLGHRRAIFVSSTFERPPDEQSPSLVKYAIKKSFDAIYWSVLTGRWERIMNAYLGRTPEGTARERLVSVHQT